MAKLDILYVVPDLSLGGVQRVVTLLAMGMAARGMRVGVATLRDSVESPLRERLLGVGIPVDALGGVGRFDLRPRWALRSRLREHAPSVVHFHGHTYRHVAPLARRFPGSSFVFTLHEEMSWSWFRADNVLRWILLRSNSRITTVAVSDAARRAAARTIGLRASAVIHNAVEVPPPDALRRHRERVEARRTNSRPHVFCSVARMVPRKGHRSLVEAARILRGDFPDFRVMLVGEGRLKAEIRRHVAASDLGAHFEFAGEVSDPYGPLADADTLVHPSETEASSLCCMEAMQLGLPVIATRAGGIPEVVEHGRTGLLTEVGDASGLADAMRAMARSPGLAADMGRSGQDEAMRRFTGHRLADDHGRLYARIAPGFIQWPANPKPD